MNTKSTTKVIFENSQPISDVTSHHNCFSGIMLNQVTDSRLERSVSVRNAIASGTTPCGGSGLVNSHGNWIRWNIFGGNGDAAIPAVPGPGSDFGVGLVSAISDERTGRHSSMYAARDARRSLGPRARVVGGSAGARQPPQVGLQPLNSIRGQRKVAQASFQHHRIRHALSQQHP